jgi:hypothetical protein
MQVLNRIVFDAQAIIHFHVTCNIGIRHSFKIVDKVAIYFFMD